MPIRLYAKTHCKIPERYRGQRGVPFVDLDGFADVDLKGDIVTASDNLQLPYNTQQTHTNSYATMIAKMKHQITTCFETANHLRAKRSHVSVSRDTNVINEDELASLLAELQPEDADPNEYELLHGFDIAHLYSELQHTAMFRSESDDEPNDINDKKHDNEYDDDFDNQEPEEEPEQEQEQEPEELEEEEPEEELEEELEEDECEDELETRNKNNDSDIEYNAYDDDMPMVHNSDQGIVGDDDEFDMYADFDTM